MEETTDVLFLLVILCTGFVVGNISVPILYYDRIVFALQEYFRSGCVFFISFGEFEDMIQKKTLLNVKKDLISMNIASAVTILSARMETHCSRNQPLFVILYPALQTANPAFKQMLEYEINNKSNAVWLLFLEQNSSMEKLFSDMNIAFNSQFLVAQQGENHVITLIEVYHISASLPLQISHFGTWTPEGGLAGPTLSLYKRRNDLKGTVLKISVLKGLLVKITKRKNGKIVAIGGYIGKVWNMLQARLNFSAEYYDAKDNSLGTKEQNDTWNGMVGMLQRREVDACAGVFIMDTTRSGVVDFMAPLMEQRSYLFIKRQRNYAFRWDNFLSPFHLELWVALAITTLILSLCLWVTYRIGCYFGIEDSTGSLLYCNIKDAFFCILSSFCQQGHDITPRSIPSRLIYLTSYLISVVVIAGYSASLISYLTVRETVIPIHNFEEFLTKGTYQLDILANSVYLSYFRETSDPIMSEIYEKILHPRLSLMPKSPIEGMRHVCHSKNHAFILPLYAIISLSRSFNCAVTIVPDAFIPGSVTLPLVKGSPYRNLFRNTIETMRRRGVLDNLRRKISVKLFYEEKKFSSVQIYEVFPLLVALSIGITVAILVLLLECIFNYVKSVLSHEKDLSDKQHQIFTILEKMDSSSVYTNDSDRREND